MKRKLINLVLIVILAISLLFCSCAKKVNNVSKKPIIAVSIVPQQTFVEAVCGDKVQVLTLIPPGSSPESYEPTPKQMEDFQNSALYFSIGVPAEQGILPKASGVKVVSLEKEVRAVYEDITFEDGDRDPHIWLSPKRVIVMIEAIKKEMIKLDKANEEFYINNAENYIKKLKSLDENIKNTLKEVKNKKIIVFHPAYEYFAKDYDIKMYALQQHGKEVTPQHLQQIIDIAKREKIKAVFYQQESDSSQCEAFAEEIGGKTVMLYPLAANYIENLQQMSSLIAEEAK